MERGREGWMSVLHNSYAPKSLLFKLTCSATQPISTYACVCISQTLYLGRILTERAIWSISTVQEATGVPAAAERGAALRAGL